MIKKYLSYLFPIKHRVYPSKVSDQLELTWVDGALVVDTKHANYSYGSLQKILRKGLYLIGKEPIKNAQKIAVLGVGGGSVIQTLIEEMDSKAQIIGVEIDPVMIAISYQFFQLDRFSQVQIVQSDANKFMLENEEKFDLVIVDIFQDIFIPDFIYSPEFISALQKSLAPKGVILFNTIVLNQDVLQKNDMFCNYFPTANYTTNRYPEVDDKNELIILQNNR